LLSGAGLIERRFRSDGRIASKSITEAVIAVKLIAAEDVIGRSAVDAIADVRGPPS